MCKPQGNNNPEAGLLSSLVQRPHPSTPPPPLGHIKYPECPLLLQVLLYLLLSPLRPTIPPGITLSRHFLVYRLQEGKDSVSDSWVECLPLALRRHSLNNCWMKSLCWANTMCQPRVVTYLLPYAQSHPEAKSHTWPWTLSLESVKRSDAPKPTSVWLVTEQQVPLKKSENKNNKRWLSCLKKEKDQRMREHDRDSWPRLHEYYVFVSLSHVLCLKAGSTFRSPLRVQFLVQGAAHGRWSVFVEFNRL